MRVKVCAEGGEVERNKQGLDDGGRRQLRWEEKDVVRSRRNGGGGQVYIVGIYALW